jgi:hypothetical protein
VDTHTRRRPTRQCGHAIEKSSPSTRVAAGASCINVSMYHVSYAWDGGRARAHALGWHGAARVAVRAVREAAATGAAVAARWVSPSAPPSAACVPAPARVGQREEEEEEREAEGAVGPWAAGVRPHTLGRGARPRHSFAHSVNVLSTDASSPLNWQKSQGWSQSLSPWLSVHGYTRADVELRRFVVVDVVLALAASTGRGVKEGHPPAAVRRG